MLKFGFVAAALVAAVPALAQPAQTAPGGPDMSAMPPAIQAFVQCLRTGVTNAPTTGTAQEAAQSVIAGCAAQQQAARAFAESAIALAPADQQAAAREQVNQQFAQIPAHLATGIEQMRASRSQAPAAAPAQPAH